jgi:putative SOS response-associated peptidase YedK
MCGRFTLKTPATVLIEHFGLSTALPRQRELFEPRYNIAPTQDVTAIRATPESEREAVSLRWGLIPSWTKDLAKARPLINARSETVAEKPSFRTAVRRRRCLIPADGFFEWQAVGKKKQPFYIRRPDEAPFALAGLWEVWDGTAQGSGPRIESCTILTTAANQMMSELHDRMPVILSPNDYAVWLDPTNDDPQSLTPLFTPLPNDELVAGPVSTYVNKPSNQGPQCIEIQRELF